MICEVLPGSRLNYGHIEDRVAWCEVRTLPDEKFSKTRGRGILDTHVQEVSLIMDAIFAGV